MVSYHESKPFRWMNALAILSSQKNVLKQKKKKNVVAPQQISTRQYLVMCLEHHLQLDNNVSAVHNELVSSEAWHPTLAEGQPQVIEVLVQSIEPLHGTSADPTGFHCDSGLEKVQVIPFEIHQSPTAVH